MYLTDRIMELHDEAYGRFQSKIVAWHFATALAKQYDAIVPFIEQHRLEYFKRQI